LHFKVTYVAKNDATLQKFRLLNVLWNENFFKLINIITDFVKNGPLKLQDIKIQKSPVVATDGEPTTSIISVGQRPTFSLGKKAISQSDCSPILATVTMLHRTLQSTLGYDTVIRRTWVMDAGRTLHLKLRPNRCR